MPVNSEIARGYKSPEFMTPAQGISLANVARQGQLQQVQLEEAQVNQQKQNALRQVLQTATDPSTGRLTPQGLSQITQLEPKMGLELTGQQEKLRLQDLAFNDKKNEVLKNIGTTYVRSYDRHLQQTGGNKEQATGFAKSEALAAIDELDKNGTLRLNGLDAQSIQGLRNLQDPEQTRSIVRALGGSVEEPEPVSTLGKLEKDYRAGRIGKKDYEAQKAKIEAPTQIMLNQNAPMDTETKRFLAKQYLAGDRTVLTGLARNPQLISEMRQTIRQVAQENGHSPEYVAAKIAEFEGIKSGERTLGTRTANIEMAGTEAQNLAPLALEASKGVDRTRFPTLNAIIMAGEKGTGDPNVVRLGIATNSLINVYARAINPQGVGTVHDKIHARELLSSAWSNGQYETGVDQLMKEIAAARKSPGQVRAAFREGITGETAPEAPATGAYSDAAKEKRYQEWKKKNGG